MNLTILKNNENYVATIVKIEHLFDIKDADRIKRTIVNGNPVIVASSVNIGDNMVYFVSGTELSEEFCYINNLFDKPEMNNNKSKKGFISKKRRVKAIKLKGEISDGILMPLESLDYVENFKTSNLTLGTEFNEINGILICKKYFVEVLNSNKIATQPKLVNKLKNILIDGQFNFHFQTSQLAKNLNKISLNEYVIITAKFHGSSAILSKIFVKKYLTVKEKIFKLLGFPVQEKTYGYVYSSGKPRNEMIKGVLDNYKNPNRGYYKENIWEIACKDYQYALEDGISIYGELCNSSIQKKYDYSKVRPNDKNYTFAVYRITRTNESGIVDEFSWNMVEKYCAKYNLQTVPVYFKGMLRDFIADDRDKLEILSKKYLEKECEFCENVVPNEGICVRIESGDFDIFKLKSNRFKVMEDIQQEAGEINVEDEQ